LTKKEEEELVFFIVVPFIAATTIGVLGTAMETIPITVGTTIKNAD
jgi:archaellum component FlaG (FlaF/FlaG flagellin family)